MNGFGESSHEVVSFQTFERRRTERRLRFELSSFIDLAFFMPRMAARYADALLGLTYTPPNRDVIPLFGARTGEKE